MTETLFVFDKANYQECQNAYRGEKNQEYYLGDYTIEAGSVIDVRAEKKAVGSCSIIRLKSRTRLSFRRSLAHIREDATDVTVLWFVKRGRLSISTSVARALPRRATSPSRNPWRRFTSNATPTMNPCTKSCMSSCLHTSSGVLCRTR